MRQDIRLKTKDVLDDMNILDILLYLCKNKIIKKESVKDYLNDDDTYEKDFERYTYFSVDIDEVLSQFEDDDLYDMLEWNNYDFPLKYVEDFSLKDDKEEFVKELKEFFSKNFARVYDKEDFKKKLCEFIDDYLIN